MPKKLALLFSSWLLLYLILNILPATTAQAAQAFNAPAFATRWQRVDQPVEALPAPGRGYTWGPTVSGSQVVSYENYNGELRQVQYFDKARMEINQPQANSADLFYVTTGLLVKELVTGRRQDGDNIFTSFSPSTVQVAGDPNDNGANVVAPTYASFQNVITATPGQNTRPPLTGTLITTRLDKSGQTNSFIPPEKRFLKEYDNITGHNIADVFVDYTNRQGPLWNGSSYEQGAIFFGNPVYVLGRPVTEPYWIRAVVGGNEKDVLVQLFERRTLTYTPSNPPAFKAEMGNVGQHYYKWRYALNSAKDQPVPIIAEPVALKPTKRGMSLQDLTYCRVGSVELKLDLYFPAGFDPASAALLPAVIFVHGGSWVSGDKSSLGDFSFMPGLLSQGIALIAVNYRLAPEYRFPAQLEDLKCAIRYLGLNATTYHLDLARLGIIGESAGGHLAVLVALTGVQAEFNRPASKLSSLTSTIPIVRSVVELYGPNDLTRVDELERLRPAILATFGTTDRTTLAWGSPVTYVPQEAASLPLFLIIQGEADLLVLPNQAQLFYQRLKTAGAEVSLRMIPNAGHAFEHIPGGTPIPKDPGLADEIVRFLEQ